MFHGREVVSPPFSNYRDISFHQCVFGRKDYSSPSGSSLYRSLFSLSLFFLSNEKNVFRVFDESTLFLVTNNLRKLLYPPLPPLLKLIEKFIFDHGSSLFIRVPRETNRDPEIRDLVFPRILRKRQRESIYYRAGNRFDAMFSREIEFVTREIYSTRNSRNSSSNKKILAPVSRSR